MFTHRPLFPQLSGSSVDTLKKLHTALSVLRDAEKGITYCIERGINRLQNEIYARKGLGSLPDELFMRIFEFAWDLNAFEKSINYEADWTELDPNTLGNTLVSVDRRFRRIALRTPILWSILTSAQSEEARANNLARSKTVGIHVYLFGEYELDRSEAFSLLLLHSQRWESLYIGFDWACGSPELLRTQLMLPSLCSLYIEGLSDDEEPCRSFVNWHMPKLAYLRLRDMVLIPSFGPSLVRCELDFTDRIFNKLEEIPHIDVNSLFGRIGGLCNLETLKLVDYPVEELDIPDTIVAVSLPKLTLLQLESDISLELLAKMLDTPRVQRVELKLQKATGLECDLKRYLPINAREYTSLRELSIWSGRIGFFSCDYFVDQICSLLEHLPQVEHLTVLAGRWDDEKYDRNKPRIRSALRSEGHDVRELLSAHANDTELPTNRKLEVVRQKATNSYNVVFRQREKIITHQA